MKVVKKVGDLSFEVEGETQRDVFKEIASFEEVFGANTCGKCSSTNVRFVVRENDGNEYFEVRCTDCGAKLSFGSHKKGGGLFPRRKDADGNWLPDGGWVKWNAKTKTAE
jgi:DNA-directed RNA polymerase subunit RPC12/RpoP